MTSRLIAITGLVLSLPPGQLAATTFTEWSDGYNLTLEQRTAEATPNSDGIPNALKYLLGVAPLERVPPDRMPRQSLSADGEFLLTAARDPASVEAVVKASLSEDLSSWNRDLSRIRIHENSGDRFQVGLDLPTAAPLFLRLEIGILDSLIPWPAPAGTLVHQFTGSSLEASIGGMAGIWFSPLTVANMPVWGFSANQASAGYDSASGGTNLYASQLAAAAAAVEGAPYLAMELTPAIGESVHLTSLAFGARTLAYPVVDPGPGPTRYELRTSADGFASAVATGEFNTAQGSNNYWYPYRHYLNVTGSSGEPVEIRLYLLGATGGTRAGAFRIDDFEIAATPMRLAPGGAYYVSPAGNDAWSGALPEPDGLGTDGPFATIERARDAIRFRHASGAPREPIEVLIRGGTYRLDQPVVFTQLDSGTAEAPVAYKAYPGEVPVFSGARPIRGWIEAEPARHTVLIPEAGARGWIFRQLFVDGKRMTLARTPNEGYFRMAGPADPTLFPPETPHETQYYTSHFYRFHQGQLKEWSSIQDINIVAFYSWHAGILPLTWVDEASRTFHTDGSMRNGYGGKVGEEMRFLVENAPDALDAPGEWRLDRDSGMLSLLGYAGQNLDLADVVAPVAGQLLVLAGDPVNSEWVEHLRFEGLSFQHTVFRLPAEGISDTQGSVYVADGAIEMLGVRNVAFTGNEIAHTGGHALWIREGSNNVTIGRNHLHDLGGGGVYIGNRDAFVRTGGTFTPLPGGSPAFVTVENNYIHDIGFIHRQSHGIWIGQSSDNIVRNNEISHTDYSALSLGWSWGYSPSGCNRNLVEYNHIHSVAQNVFPDCGGIYTLGEQLGTVIRHNHIHDVWGYREYQGKGIYPDEGSSGILFSHNIVHGTSGAAFGINYASDLTVRNNVFAFNASGGAIERGNNGGGRNLDLVFENNIVLIDHPRPFEASGTLASAERNLYWNRNGEIRFQGGASLAEWQATSGWDITSRVADPLFVNPDAGDFRLQTGSPAFSLGFEPIDTTQIGLYGDTGWRDLPAAVELARETRSIPPFAYAWPDPRNEYGQIMDDFEAGPHLYVNQLTASESVGPPAPYLSATLYPDPGLAVDVSTFSFAARSLVDPAVGGGTGPTRYELRTSADGFTNPVAAGTFETAEGDHNYWYYHCHGSLAERAQADEPLELRLYLLGATGASRSGTFRLDDLRITAKARPQGQAECISYRFTDATLNPATQDVGEVTAGPLVLFNVGTNGFSRLNPAGGYPEASGEVVMANLDVDGRYASGGRSYAGNVSFSSARFVSGQRSLLMDGASRFSYENRSPHVINPLVDGGAAQSLFFLSIRRGQSSLTVRWIDEAGREGPKMTVDGNTGQLSVNGQSVAALAEGGWARLGMQASVGLANTGLWTLTIEVPGQDTVTISNLAFSTSFNEWQNMEWQVTDANPSNPAGFFLDDAICR